MGGFTVIQDVSALLRGRIFSALSSAPGVDFQLTDEATNLTLSPPGEESDGHVASLYLYHIEHERHLRNQRPLPDRSDPSRVRKPPLPLQLRYLLTPTDSEETNNQLLLARVLQDFYDEPTVPAPGDEPRDSFGGASPELRVLSETPSIEQLTQIWNALSQPFRLSLVLLVEVVAIDSGRPAELVPRVERTHSVVGPKERGP